MKRFVVEPKDVVRTLVCDRCGAEADREGFAFGDCVSIGIDAGYDSVFGDGNRVEVDLCGRCLQQTLGAWLRIGPRIGGELAERLERFDVERHGGEWPASEDSDLAATAELARAAADRAGAAIDEALDAVGQSEQRIVAMESAASMGRGESSYAGEVFAVIEHDRSRHVFIGKIVGFPHVEFEGPTLGDVEQKLRKAAASISANGDLVLEAEFAAVVRLGAWN